MSRTALIRSLAVTPTNLYGTGDNNRPTNSQVNPGLIRRFHETKENGVEAVNVCCTGKPRGDFLDGDDMADACLRRMLPPDDGFDPLLAGNRDDGTPPIVNIGVGKDITFGRLAWLIAEVFACKRRIEFDRRRLDGTHRKILDSDRLRNLGWRDATDLGSGLRFAKVFKSGANSAVARAG